MKILITGANGMVARAAIEHCRFSGDDVVALARQQLDIADRAKVFDTIAAETPDTILNCAAFTDVDGAETNKDVCYSANSTGAENLAAAAKEYGSVFVTISTDYVFDGKKEGFYTETDVPNPQGVYAESKLDGERRAISMNPDSIVVRSGWIYGEGGTNFLSVMHNLLADGKAITAIHDAFGTPTFAVDLAARLRELAVKKTDGIFHVTNSGEGTSYLGFAEKVCEAGGFDVGLVKPVSNCDLKRPAPRPANSRMRSVREEEAGLPPMPSWADSLAKFISRQ
ncbi:MAG: dTDP-4-dehydrorhamnose reductase [Blastocatellia bacterium]